MSRGTKWTAEEEAQLTELFPKMSSRDLAVKLGRTLKSVVSRAKVLGVVKGKRRAWSADDIATIKEKYPSTPTQQLADQLGRSLHLIYGMARRLGIEKTEAYLASPAACRLRRGDKVGHSYRYPKGHVPANKGLRRPGYSAGRMATTQFRKGHKNEGHPTRAWKPIGTERVNADGYLERKITDKGRGAQRWKPVHVILWEEKNGPRPAGHAVAFRDGNRENIVYENLELVSQREMMLRHTFHRYGKDIALTIIARAQLTRTINKISRRTA